ncbi:cell division protein FtsQ [Candidatus Hoaglandella endobia]|uniref:Cell division protein FtsQ n=1 Tax=Candidatus Hoaglandella endobia TaxID=1778263 RepID=A0A143WUB6_9ENTR|nr:cell division protein FtsQ [Candidatus Hoaglandella endobia]CUX97288.1 Cell division protein FtsQ [Candidatus Hoaglandella endobia]
MSQIAINVKCQIKPVVTGRSNSAQLAGLLFFLMALDSIVWGSWMLVSWIKNAHNFSFSQLVVTGECHYTTNNDIRQVIRALRAPETFITQNVNFIQQHIERMPWIKHVSVRKQWPDELKIHLIEYVPVARWNDFYLLDSRGEVFRAPADRIGNHPVMPMLYGPEGSEREVLVGYRNLDQVLTSAKLKLNAVSMSTRHSWYLVLRDSLRLELGRNDKIKRLQRFIGIYPVILHQAQNANKRISYVDLRYDVGLAVGWSTAFIAIENSNQQQIQLQAQ